MNTKFRRRLIISFILTTCLCSIIIISKTDYTDSSLAYRVKAISNVAYDPIILEEESNVVNQSANESIKNVEKIPEEKPEIISKEEKLEEPTQEQVKLEEQEEKAVEEKLEQKEEVVVEKPTQEEKVEVVEEPMQEEKVEVVEEPTKEEKVEEVLEQEQEEIVEEVLEQEQEEIVEETETEIIPKEKEKLELKVEGVLKSEEISNDLVEGEIVNETN